MSKSFKKFIEELSISYEDAESNPTEYGRFISMLFSARDKAHELHLASKSYSEHVALNELYDLLVDSADEMAEMFQGKHGIVGINTLGTDAWAVTDAKAFIKQLVSWLELSAKELIGDDAYIINKYEELVGDVYKIKYKIDNLS